MTVVSLCAHGHSKADAQRRDEVLSFVTVIDERMNHLHLLATLPEVQADREWQPMALTITVGTVNPDNGIYVTLPFNRRLIDR